MSKQESAAVEEPEAAAVVVVVVVIVAVVLKEHINFILVGKIQKAKILNEFSTFASTLDASSYSTQSCIKWLNVVLRICFDISSKNIAN